jgi:hypothetical protein
LALSQRAALHEFAASINNDKQPRASAGAQGSMNELSHLAIFMSWPLALEVENSRIKQYGSF